jgi:tetratricopeptide (TPR) repeat protein
VFVLGVAPVLGFVPFDFQHFSTVADHYLYFSMFGPALAAAYALDASGQRGRNGRPGAGRLAWGCGAAVLAALGVRTAFQTTHWRDTVALFEHAVRVSPRNAMAYTNLGEAYSRAMRFDDALRAYQRAAEADPAAAPTRSNYASALAGAGRFDEAEAEYRAAMRLDPNFNPARRGMARLQATRAQEPRPAASRPAG